MAEAICRAEALKIVDASAFVQLRLSQAGRPQIKASVLWGLFVRISARDRAIAHGLGRCVLRAFDERRPNGASDDKYIKEDLEDWLDALADVELGDQIRAHFNTPHPLIPFSATETSKQSYRPAASGTPRSPPPPPSRK